MGEQSPSFQLYPRDLLADTHNLTDAAFGLYVRLLCAQWMHGSLPAVLESEEGESMIDVLPIGDMKERRKSFRAIAKHFQPHPSEEGRVAQARLERVREEQRKHREEASEAGKLGAAKRWGKHPAEIATPLPSHSDPISGEYESPNAMAMRNDSSATATATASANNTPDGVLAPERAKRVKPNPPTVDFGDLEPKVLLVIANDAGERKSQTLADSVVRGLRADLAEARDEHGIEALKHGLGVAISKGKPVSYAIGAVRKYTPGEGQRTAPKPLPQEQHGYLLDGSEYTKKPGEFKAGWSATRPLVPIHRDDAA